LAYSRTPERKAVQAAFQAVRSQKEKADTKARQEKKMMALETKWGESVLLTDAEQKQLFSQNICAVCRTEFHKHSALHQHVMKSSCSGKTFQCNKCDPPVIYHCANSLKTHCRRHHSKG
jgi:hypothetical protein